MPKFSEQLPKYLELFNAHKLKDAEKFLRSLECDNTAEERRKQHFFAQIYLRQEKHEDSLNVLETARKKYGEHVGLLSDIANIYYLLGRYREWQMAVDDLQKSFQRVGPQLSENSRFRTALVLARFLEEQGNLGGAFTIYDTLLASISEKSQPVKYYNILAQNIRLRSTYGRRQGLGPQYKKLLSVEKKDQFLQLDITIQHALLLAEMILVGVDHGRERLLRLLENKELRSDDRALVFYDYAELLLSQNAVVDDELLSIGVTTRDSYEKTLLDFLQQKKSENNLRLLSALEKDIPPAGYLRLLNLFLMRETNQKWKDEIKNRMVLLLDGYDALSKEFWHAKIGKALESEAITVECDAKNFSVQCKKEERSLKKREALFLILIALAKKSTISLDDLTKAIWQTEYNSSYYHRIRVSCRRLNELLFELTAVSKAISVNAREIRLKENLRISLK
jgi:hypothetical protein